MKFPLAAALAIAAVTPGLAQQHGAHAMAHDGMADAMSAMTEGMTFEPSGDADVDFARAMIVHHEGAIAMARIVLDEGDDPKMRALAEEGIETQQAEITLMQDWLSRNGG